MVYNIRMNFNYKRRFRTGNYLLELWTYLYFTNDRSVDEVLASSRLLAFKFFRRLLRNKFITYSWFQKARFKREQITVSEIGIVKDSLHKMSTSELEDLHYFIKVPVSNDVILDSLKNTFSVVKNLVPIILTIVTGVLGSDFLGSLLNTVMENSNNILQITIIIIGYYCMYLMYKTLIVEVLSTTMKKREINRILPLLVNDILKERKQMKP
ncbi:hypothetical protein [Streptococcus gallolyticus]|uniref:Uncharacterized protein n=1 Tax=Streptococcus gallolyticus TaxID=315405 RepID=A0A1H9PDM2_9STRE|nr:hypothetical protein [Streptococcus gallolyticus]SER45909.1 hypothetical protein SAMN04487840_10473 [Streptococcus gallolyticus]